MAVSREGKQIAFLVGGPEDHDPIPKTTFVPVGAGANSPARLLHLDPRISGAAGFTADGKAIVYPVRENGVDNLWMQPLDGSSRRQITNFKADTIQDFRFSPDGKTLGVFQQHLESDAVLLRDISSK